jgi:hypothetical protein
MQETVQGSVAIYPNPTDSDWNITSAENMHEWTLCDQLGSVVFSGDGAGQRQFTLGTAELNSGMYLFSVQHSDGSGSRKILIRN